MLVSWGVTLLEATQQNPAALLKDTELNQSPTETRYTVGAVGRPDYADKFHQRMMLIFRGPFGTYGQKLLVL